MNVSQIQIYLSIVFFSTLLGVWSISARYCENNLQLTNADLRFDLEPLPIQFEGQRVFLTENPIF